jgi:hypothetical protein
MQQMQQQSRASVPSAVAPERRLRACRVVSASAQATQPAGAAAAAVQAASGLKADIIRLSGSKYGHDLSESVRQEVRAAPGCVIIGSSSTLLQLM